MEEKTSGEAPTQPPKPQSLITEEHVKAALKNDKGQGANLESWKVVDFTSKGDNYACFVTSVKVVFSCSGKESEVSYVVKLNPCLSFESFEEFTHVLFKKEIRFYTTLLPELNRVLESVGEGPLHLPQHYYSNLEDKKEMIFLEDLRPRNFKMFDRKKGMDAAHVTLLLEELAKLHGASLLLQNQTPNMDITERHEYLLQDWINYSDNAADVIMPMMQDYVSTGIQMLEKVGGYEKAVSWLEGLRERLLETLESQLGKSKYNVVCHGDCWNNNVLYRYNDSGQPIEVMLLDLQVCRWASPATDLNYLLYTSLNGSVRKPNINIFLYLYHDSLSNVMDAGRMDVPFSKSELHQEFRDKNVMGIIFALMILPVVLMESNDVPDMTNRTDEEIGELMNEFKVQALAMLDSNPLMKPRFLSLFDEMMERGVIS